MIDNFYGQERLIELNLSHNKIHGMTSEMFRYLTVSTAPPVHSWHDSTPYHVYVS